MYLFPFGHSGSNAQLRLRGPQRTEASHQRIVGNPVVCLFKEGAFRSIQHMFPTCDSLSSRDVPWPKQKSFAH